MAETVKPPCRPFHRGDGDFALIARLLHDYVGPQKATLAAGLFCTLAGSGMTALLAYALDPTIKYLFLDKTPSLLAVIPAGVVMVVLFRAVFNYGQAVFMNMVGQRLIADSQRNMVRSIIGYDLARLNAVHSGELISNFLYDATLLRDSVTNGVTAVGALVQLALLGAVMVYMDWQLSLVSVVILPVIGWVTRSLGRSARKSSTQGMVETGGLSTALAEMLDGRRIVRAYALEEQAMERVFTRINQRLRYLLKAMRSGAISAPAADLFGGLAVAAVILFAGYQGMHGHLELSAFTSFIAAMLLAQQPVRNLSNMWTIVTSGLGAAQRVFALIDVKPTIVDAPRAKPLAIAPPLSGAIRFENVRFHYGAHGDPALNGVSLEIAAGRKVALVGPSGAGKSTILSMLLRFYDIESGAITIDGQDIRAVTLASLRSSIALVTQEPFLFDESIAANIGYGRPGAPMSAIIEAAKAAAAHDFILNLPNGYDAIAGEGGLRFSGGQRQRIAIARAMLKNAPILLLDEATSALDTENERLVQEALKQLMKGRTTIVIAHRLTTVLDADRIYAMDAGRVVEQGTHAELMVMGGLYARLYRHDFADEDAQTAKAV